MQWWLDGLRGLDSVDLATMCTAFAATLVIPFLSVLTYFEGRAFQYVWSFWFWWFVVAVLSFLVPGFGITPMGHGDLVTKEQIEGWFRLQWVKDIQFYSVMALGIGFPFLVLTWVHQNKVLSRPLRVTIQIVKTIGFLFALASFIVVYFIPYAKHVRLS